jgi:hypothetical protein
VAHFLNDAQYRTLTAIGDTLIPTVKRQPAPHGFWSRSASDLDVPRHFTGRVRDRLETNQQAQFRLGLHLLNQPVAGALLVRSGLANPNIRRNPRLHPTSFVVGDYAEPIESWSGVPISRYSTQFANLDHRHYGVVLEHPPAHPGFMDLALPCRSGSRYKALLSRVRHHAYALAITRDRDPGRLTVVCPAPAPTLSALAARRRPPHARPGGERPHSGRGGCKRNQYVTRAAGALSGRTGPGGLL